MGFFVQNVENVQGHERDIIVFSTTFGRDKHGSFRRNFGALGQPGGERRLKTKASLADFRATTRRARAKLFDNLARSARELLHGLRPNYVAARQIAFRFSTPSVFNAFLAGLDLVIQSAEDFARLYSQIGGDLRTPKERFVREYLPEIFQHYFGQKASKSMEGPYNHFASAVLKEMGEEFSEESVHRARHRKPRRKMQR